MSLVNQLNEQYGRFFNEHVISNPFGPYRECYNRFSDEEKGTAIVACILLTIIPFYPLSITFTLLATTFAVLFALITMPFSYAVAAIHDSLTEPEDVAGCAM